MLCWMNGEYMEQHQLRISPFDHGFLYGAGFFETFRTYNGKLFLFEAHMARLQEALNHFRIVMPYSKEDIYEVVQTLDKAAGYTDGYFRLNVSAGVHDIGLAPDAYTEPNVIVFRKALPPVSRGATKAGVFLHTPRRAPETSKRYKSHHFLNNIDGRFELPSLKAHEGIFLTEEGFIAEGVTSNVFWVTDHCLYTPSEETGILMGTTRQFIIQLAGDIGLEVAEGLFQKEDLLKADEVFVTNAVQEMVPLHAIEDTLFSGNKGVYYNALHTKYQQAIKEGR